MPGSAVRRRKSRRRQRQHWGRSCRKICAGRIHASRQLVRHRSQSNRHKDNELRPAEGSGSHYFDRVDTAYDCCESELNVTTPAQLVALLRSRPGQLNYSSPGTGSPHHLAGEYLKKLAGVQMQHVVYRGAGPAVQDAVAGHVPITISGMPPVVELVRADKLRAVAVTSAKRSALFPNTMALAEFGPEYKDFDFTNWFGFLAPAGVPDAI